MKKKIILTFDLEEFDLPLEFNCPISEEEQFKITNEGLERLVNILNRHEVKATFFTTGYFCEKNELSIQALSKKHEINSHAYYHSQFDEEFLIKSKKILESTTGKPVLGFRMPRLDKVDYEKLEQAGYKYDSSINPTFIPGRYNNIKISRFPFKITNSNIIEFPLSVSPIIRFPLFWLSFKNLPLSLYQFLCNFTLKKDKFIHLYFHPWEFAKIDQFDIPTYIKKLNGDNYAKKFDKLVESLKNQGEFVTVTDFIEQDKSESQFKLQKKS